MRIVIVDGSNEADYIIKMFNNKSNKLTVINDNAEVCKLLSENNGVDVYYGDATKLYVLSDNEIENADLFIALSTSDINNYVACQMAKNVFNVKKSICTVINPKNVKLFKQLGIDSVISSTYYLAEIIKNESSVENMIKTLSVQNEIVISEIEVEKDSFMVGKRLADIGFPAEASIGCVYRDTKVMIPNGSTVFEENDRLVMISTIGFQEKLLKFFKRKK